MKTLIKKAKRIVFKFGTNALSTDNGDLALSRLYSFMEDIAALRAQGKEVMIVTSGAVGVGKRRLGMTRAPDVVWWRHRCCSLKMIFPTEAAI